MTTENEQSLRPLGKKAPARARAVREKVLQSLPKLGKKSLLCFRPSRPQEELIKIAENPKTPVDVRAKIWSKLMDKSVPDLKALDINVDEKKQISIEVVSYGGIKDVGVVDTAKRIAIEEAIQ